MGNNLAMFTRARSNSFRLLNIIFGGCLLAMPLSSRASAGDQPWTEVRSPHFRVLTDGSDKAARRVARELEQIRGAMSEVFPGIRLDSGVPLLVFAPRDEDSMKFLAPVYWKTKVAKP